MSFGEEKMKTTKDKRMVKLEFHSNMPFWTYINLKKFSTFNLRCMVIPLGPHAVYT